MIGFPHFVALQRKDITVYINSLKPMPGEGSAPPGQWISGPGGSQYYFAVESDKVDKGWHSARAWCMQNGGDLASIEDETEKTWIATQVRH